jgi:pimeloyl-ACP methyl ester carboxylesterase
MREEGFVTTEDGLRIWYGLTGLETGPTLILCDGLACDGFIWPHLIDHFAGQFRILRWHYRGHGRSEAPDDDDALRMQVLVSDLAAILDHLGIESAVLAGHSMGVQIILEFFAAHSRAVRALALVCGSYGYPLSTFGGSDRAAVLPRVRALVERAPRLAGALWANLVPTGLSFRIAQRTEIHPERVSKVEFLPYLEHASRMDLRVFLGTLTHAAEHTAEAVLETIDVPTLIVAGEHDGFTPAEISREMAGRIRDAELFTLPGGTHTAPIEFPTALNTRLHRFFTKHGLYGLPTGNGV